MNEAFDLPQGSGRHENDTRACELLQPSCQMRRVAYGRVVDVEIVIYGTEHDFSGVHTNADL